MVPMSKPSILFIGTGNMGNPIAANLLRAGYRLTLADLDETKFANLLPLGGVKADDLLASAREADAAEGNAALAPKARHITAR